MQSKPTLETIFNHRSIRKFTQQAIPEDIVETLIQAGQAASTSNNLQCVSVIRVKAMDLREKLREISGMSYVTECAEFLVFCADFSKHKALMPEAQLDWTEVSLIGAVDTGIFAQNVLLAAESLGLGGVYIGALRNHIADAAAVLNLPQYCVPLMGMCLGYPAQDPQLKPRLPQNLVCFENQHQPLDEQALEKYNEVLANYYQARIGEKQIWQDAINKTLNKPVRPHIKAFFQQQGLLKR
ncbi:nitroreductase A [Pasteurellaceae bacterium Pebbles2]|nr:nitroreductase A [Pasteurellaceae bacterium Pebbles2]